MIHPKYRHAYLGSCRYLNLNLAKNQWDHSTPTIETIEGVSSHLVGSTRSFDGAKCSLTLPSSAGVSC